MAWGVGAAAALVAIGFAVGAFGTLVGAGGGFLLTPILLVLYPHDSPQTITAISLVAVFCNATSGSVAYGRLKRTDYRSGLVFAAAALPGSVVGAIAVGYVSRSAFDLIMCGVLAVLALWLWRSPAPLAPDEQRSGVRREIVDRLGNRYAFVVPLRRGALFSSVVGFVSSFLGIGGGVIHVPLLVRVLGFPVHVATATSHFVLAILAGSATITHVLQGSFAHGHGLRRSAALSVGVVVGAQLGARASLRASGRTIERLLAIALAILVVRLALLVV